MADDPNAKITPPYLPFRTFLNSLEVLAQGVPPRIDRSIWKTQTGSVKSQIFSAYRFLGLINNGGQPTTVLNDLVQNRQTPGEQLNALLRDKYAQILKHDLSTMTVAMINGEFETAFSVQGDVKRKAITFFLQAAKAAGMTLSKFLLDQSRPGSGPRARRRASKNGSTVDADFDDETEEAEPSAHGTTKTITLSSGGELSVRVSVDLFALSTDDRNFVFALIDTLRDYEAKREAEQ
jgi:hypothetical protein